MAADYDLTLTGSDRKVSAHTRETIRAVYAAGKFVTLASGRLGGSAEVARELFPGDVPLILGNGGLVQSCTTGETLSETLMDEPTALTMLRWCRRRASAAIVYGRSGIYTDRVNAASEMYAQRSSSTPLPLPSPEEAAHEGIYKILLLGLPLTVRRAAKKLHSPPPQPVEFLDAGERCEPQSVHRHIGGVRREGLVAENDGIVLRLMDDLAARQRRLQRVDALGGDAVVVFKLQVRERAQRREKLVIEIAPSRGAQIERGELRQQGERGDIGDRVVREIELAQLRAAGERGNPRVGSSPARRETPDASPSRRCR